MGSYGIGLAVLGVGVLGYWLLGPKSKSTGSVPAGIPSLNQSLRGTSVPITFGTNRVNAQVPWTNNFKAVRQKSSGKGGAKGGGSGGFGGAKGGGSAATSYEYFWDMMFNFGMVDTPSGIRRMWIGGDDVDKESLSKITGGVSDAIIKVFPIVTSINDENVATMNFQESFFAPGYATGDTNLDVWPHFEDISGACAFPYMVWLGFEQLDLGQSPSIPQLTAEVVPLDTQFDFTFTGISYDVHPNPDSDQPIGPAHMKANGNLYTAAANGAGGLTVNNVTADTNFGIDYITAEADASAVTGGGFVDWMGLIPVAGTPYFYSAWLVDSLTFPVMAFLVYKIDGEAITTVGYYKITYHTGHNGNFTGCFGNGRMPSGDVVVAYYGRSVNGASYMTTIPDPATLDGHSVDAGTVEFATAVFDFGSGDGFLGGLATGSVRPSAQVIFVPSTTDDTVKVLVYIDAARMLAENEYPAGHAGSPHNAFLYDLSGANPNGIVLSMTYGGGGGVGTTAQWGYNDFLKDAEGNPATPWPDVGKDSTGTTTNGYDDYFLSCTNGIIIAGRQYSDIRNSGNWIIYDLTGAQQKSFVSDFGTATDWPSGSLANSNQIYAMSLYQDADTGVIWFNARRLNTAANEHEKNVDFGPLLKTGDIDVTPPYIISRILTSDVFGFAASALFGFSVTSDRIDQDSYADAVAYCVAQGIKVSVTYQDQNNLLDIINDLLSLYGGFLTDNDGFVQFGVVKSDDAPVRTIDNHHLVPSDAGKPPIQVTKAALEDGYNKIQYNYFDRLLNYKQAQVFASDEVDMDINGPRVKTFQAQYVMPGSLAQMIATRALWNNLYGNDQYAFTLGWKDADLKPGALITLVDSFDPTLSGGVLARILKWQENKRGKFDVTAVQQRPYIISASASYTNTASIGTGFGSLVDPAQPPLHQTAYELPLEFQGSKPYLYFGYAPGAQVMGAQLYMSTDGENYVLTQDAQPYIISGALARPLEKRHQNYVDERVEFWLYPTSPFSAATPTFVQTYEMDDISAALRSAGAGTIIVGSEAIALEGLTLLGQNHYRAKRAFRGWGGTPISTHNSGEWFHQQAAGMFTHEISTDDIGKNISYKIAPYNFLGKATDLSSIDAQSYHILGMYWLPRAMSRVHVFVDSPLSVSPSTPVKDYVAVFGGESPVTLKWSDSSNTDGFGAGGFGDNVYGHFTPDVPEPSYFVNVQSSNGALVSSFVVSTGFFNYTVAQNVADWGGFQSNPIFNIQPFNTRGIGPTSVTRSLMMF